MSGPKQVPGAFVSKRTTVRQDDDDAREVELDHEHVQYEEASQHGGEPRGPLREFRERELIQAI